MKNDAYFDVESHIIYSTYPVPERPGFYTINDALSIYVGAGIILGIFYKNRPAMFATPEAIFYVMPAIQSQLELESRFDELLDSDKDEIIETFKIDAEIIGFRTAEKSVFRSSKNRYIYRTMGDREDDYFQRCLRIHNQYFVPRTTGIHRLNDNLYVYVQQTIIGIFTPEESYFPSEYWKTEIMKKISNI